VEVPGYKCCPRFETVGIQNPARLLNICHSNTNCASPRLITVDDVFAGTLTFRTKSVSLNKSVIVLSYL
jgi:hypothetical protein